MSVAGSIFSSTFRHKTLIQTLEILSAEISLFVRAGGVLEAEPFLGAWALLKGPDITGSCSGFSAAAGNSALVEARPGLPWVLSIMGNPLNLSVALQ